ncbi:MAG TPA: hypothetical protein VLB85_04940 [Acidimicrobiia bacterium]|nr:hypothetical protein [Acidimicrobiia bacterium]
MALPITQTQMPGQSLVFALTVGAGVSVLVVASGLSHDSALGAPAFWPWLLTGLQVLALWSAGRRYWWGWLVGGCVQFPWIAYAVVTDQIGFIPGCLISASVQLCSFLRNSTRTSQVR